jgi:hypothetical protein
MDVDTDTTMDIDLDYVQVRVSAYTMFMFKLMLMFMFTFTIRSVFCYACFKDHFQDIESSIRTQTLLLKLALSLTQSALTLKLTQIWT